MYGIPNATRMYLSRGVLLAVLAVLALGLHGTENVQMALADSPGKSAQAEPALPAAPACPGGQCFTDVAAGSTFFDFVNRLYQQELMSGYACGGPNEPCDAANRPYFRQGSDVTRGQMTKFVDNARRQPGIYIDTSTDTLPIFARSTFPNHSAINGASTSGSGVVGSSETGKGVSGLSATGNGVYGYSSSYEGIRGETPSNYAGVYGRNTGTGIGPGVRGDATTAPGVYGLSVNNAGVWGKSTNSYGVRAESDNTIALYATTTGSGSTAIYSSSSTGRGVSGTTSSPSLPAIQGVNSSGGNGVSGYASGNGTAIYGNNSNISGGYAGYFDGNVHVTGSCCAAAAGTFKIDHPLDPANKYLNHAALESPDMMDVYSGNVTTDAAGNARVTLPQYFEALNRDFRYQLTVVGQFAQAIVLNEVKDNSFGIKTDKPNVKVSWQVTGIRHDPYAEQHPINVEQDKQANEKGKYLYPKENGQPETLGIGYEMQQGQKRP